MDRCRLGTGCCTIGISLKKTVRIYRLYSLTRSSTNLLLCFWSTLCVVRSFTTPLHHHLVFHLPPGSVGNERRRKEGRRRTESSSSSKVGVSVVGWGGSPLLGETGRKDHHSSELQSLFFSSSFLPSFQSSVFGDQDYGWRRRRRRRRTSTTEVFAPFAHFTTL